MASDVSKSRTVGIERVEDKQIPPTGHSLARATQSFTFRGRRPQAWNQLLAHHYYHIAIY